MNKTMKKISILVLLSFLFLTACQDNQIKISIISAGGTYNYQLQPNSTNALLGTTIFVQLRDSLGHKVNSEAKISILGPANWNANKAIIRKYPANSDWVIFPEITIPPIVGKYTLQVEVMGITQSSVFEIKNISDSLPFAQPNIVEFTNTKLQLRWNLVKDAQGFIVKLRNATDETAIAPTIFTKSTFLEYITGENGYSFDQLKQNIAIVIATNFDTESETVAPSEQINISDAAAFLNLMTQKTSEKTRLSNLNSTKTIVKYEQ